MMGRVPLNLCLALVVRVEVSSTNGGPKVATGKGVAKHRLHAKGLAEGKGQESSEHPAETRKEKALPAALL